MSIRKEAEEEEAEEAEEAEETEKTRAGVRCAAARFR